MDKHLFSCLGNSKFVLVDQNNLAFKRNEDIPRVKVKYWFLHLGVTKSPSYDILILLCKQNKANIDKQNGQLFLFCLFS